MPSSCQGRSRQGSILLSVCGVGFVVAAAVEKYFLFPYTRYLYLTDMVPTPLPYLSVPLILTGYLQ